MPRNASGTYSLPESAFVAGTTIESAKVNSDLSDISTALTQSLATTGVSTMSGQFKAAAGTVGAPSISFAGSITTGFYRSGADEISWAAAGAQKGIFDATGNVTFSGNLIVGGTLTVTGAVALTGTFSVGGIFTASSDLVVVGSATIGSNLHVAGTVSLAGRAIIGGNLAVIGSVSGGLSVTATLAVGGNAQIVGNLSVTGSTPGKLLAIIEDNKAQNTSPQSLTSGVDNIREINTLVYNFGTLVSVASNRFTLPAGTWEISWIAQAEYGSLDVLHQSFLYNQTDATEVKRGSGGRVDGGDNSFGLVSETSGCTVVTIADSKAFEIRHRVSGAAEGGDAANFGTEVYTRIIVRYV